MVPSLFQNLSQGPCVPAIEKSKEVHISMDLEFQELAPFTAVKRQEERSGGQKCKKINRKLGEIQRGKFHFLLLPS